MRCSRGLKRGSSLLGCGILSQISRGRRFDRRPALKRTTIVRSCFDAAKTSFMKKCRSARMASHSRVCLNAASGDIDRIRKRAAA